MGSASIVVFDLQLLHWGVFLGVPQHRGVPVGFPLKPTKWGFREQRHQCWFSGSILAQLFPPNKLNNKTNTNSPRMGLNRIRFPCFPTILLFNKPFPQILVIFWRDERSFSQTSSFEALFYRSFCSPTKSSIPGYAYITENCSRDPQRSAARHIQTVTLLFVRRGKTQAPPLRKDS